MQNPEQKFSWVSRVEDLVRVLENSSISELELSENGTEIVIRRQSGVTAAPIVKSKSGKRQPLAVKSADESAADHSQGISSPITGVYYASPSPTEPSFVQVGDIVQIGQVIALVEAMKVFNEIQADISGRVTKLLASNGDVVQKGSVLLRIEPL